MASAEFVVNNKVHIATKVLPFIVNYRRELRMEGDIRRRGKVEKAMEFVERMKQVQEKVGTVLKKAQENMKRQADKRRRESKNWKREDKVLLSTKDLVFKERLARKLVDRFVGPYAIEKVVSTNAVKLQLPISMKIHLVVNINQIV